MCSVDKSQQYSWGFYNTDTDFISKTVACRTASAVIHMDFCCVDEERSIFFRFYSFFLKIHSSPFILVTNILDQNSAVLQRSLVTNTDPRVFSDTNTEEFSFPPPSGRCLHFPFILRIHTTVIKARAHTEMPPLWDAGKNGKQTC